PVPLIPDSDSPILENPTQDKPTQGKPIQENPTQLNIDITNKKEQITNSTNIDSFSSDERPSILANLEAKRKETICRDMNVYREIIKENIGYDYLLADLPYCHDRLEEILELIVETVCSTRKYIRVAGSDYPAEVVRSRLMKLDMEHIRFVFDCLNENTTKIRNIKQYLLTTLYNAPTTIGNYYSALVQHDQYGESTHDR
ncbi:MAG: helix-turn-helix domain-containing protein, partial [Oscillospiraceae bacterium]|nr:helix-turn-helix domain-containing protein [Oscillospiraceae bacterium]